MDNAHQFRNAIAQTPVVAILRGDFSKILLNVAEIGLEYGLRVLEITLNSPLALESISLLAKHQPELMVGAGTVLSVVDLHSAVNAGARFIISPHLDREIVAAATKLNIPSIPGVLTPTEIISAINAGAEMVKLFPASLGGPDYIRQLQGPLPQIPILATGGVSTQNMRQFFNAGARAVALGSSVFDQKITQTGGLDVFRSRLREMRQCLDSR